MPIFKDALIAGSILLYGMAYQEWVELKLPVDCNLELSLSLAHVYVSLNARDFIVSNLLVVFGFVWVLNKIIFCIFYLISDYFLRFSSDMRADFVHFVHLHCQWWVKSLNRIGSVFLPYVMKVPVNSHKGYHCLCFAWFTYGQLPMKHLFAGECISVAYIYILLFVWRFALN
jgi:hypothetical protein